MNNNHIEIERKFLVRGDFMPFVVRTERIVQAYICSSIERTVRIRIKGDSAYLTIKGATNEKGVSRTEFEYLIPVEDAQELLGLAQPGVIEKERHYIPVGKHTYEVDVFHGRHKGLIIAELELSSESEPFDRPDWLGKEVTGNERYYNAYLASQFH